MAHYTPNYIRDFWCGEGPPPRNYARAGTRVECFQRGFGAGMSTERCARYAPDDIRRLPYWNATVDRALRRANIRSCRQLFNRVEAMRSPQRCRELIFDLHGENVGYKPYNRFCDFLYNGGVPARYIPRARNEVHN